MLVIWKRERALIYFCVCVCGVYMCSYFQDIWSNKNDDDDDDDNTYTHTDLDGKEKYKYNK